MKIRIADRILAAFAGIILIAMCAGIVAQVFFGVPVLDTAKQYLTERENMLIPTIAVCVGLFLDGVYCFLILFRHKKTSGFVMQQTEGGELAISLKAMETLVLKCLDLHPEMKLDHIKVDAEKEGVLIRLKISLASGVSIPLAVGALQKQINQYLTLCSGVDVKEVRVQVETTSDIANNSPYMVPELTEGASSAALPTATDETETTSIDSVKDSARAEDVPVQETNVQEAFQPADKDSESITEQNEETVSDEEQQKKTLEEDFSMDFSEAEGSLLTPEAFTDEGEVS